MITDRKANPPKPGEELMLDSFITFSDDEELQLADALCFIVGGFHTTGFCKKALDLSGANRGLSARLA